MFTVASIRREASPTGGTHVQQLPARAANRAQTRHSVHVTGTDARATR
ncbi:hypothetical protein [Pandoraea sp. NPDC087047]